MKRILLADDNPDLCSALRLMIETRLGLEVLTEARDMGHVLAQVEDSRPDCILLDWELPGRPNRERVTVLRTLVPGLRVIAISARPESCAEAASEKVDAFISKGESPDEILRVIRQVCPVEESQ